MWQGGIEGVYFSILWPISKDQLVTEKTEKTGHVLMWHSEIVAVGLQLRILNWVEDDVFWPWRAVAYGVGLIYTLQNWIAFPVPAPACGKLDAA